MASVSEEKVWNRGLSPRRGRTDNRRAKLAYNAALALYQLKGTLNMTNDDIQAFGQAVALHYDAHDDHAILGDTLEPGDVDKNGNNYSQYAQYEAEMDLQANKAVVNLEKYDPDRPF